MDPGRWQWKGPSHPRKLKYCRNLTKKIFCVISTALVGGVYYPSAEKQSIYSTASADSVRGGTEMVPKSKLKWVYIYIYTWWNDKIVALEKTTWFHFRLWKPVFFLLQTINLLASCVQIPRAIGAFYYVWKWHNVQRARSDMRRFTTHALYRFNLWQDHYQLPQNANLDCHE